MDKIATQKESLPYSSATEVRYTILYMKKIIWLLCSVVLLSASYFSPVQAAAGINKQVTFSGILYDDEGALVTGSVDLTFALYDTESEGVALWTGQYTAANNNPVSVIDGFFRVLLGSGDGNELALDFNSDTYYLGVQVGTDPEMTPRERLGAAGYAINADTVDGLHASDFLSTELPLSLVGPSSVALLLLEQTGSGAAMTVAQGGSDVLTINADGSLYSDSTIASRFAGGIEVGDGYGIQFGSAAGGIALFQDTVNHEVSELFFTQRNSGVLQDIYLNTVAGLTLTANVGADGNGPYSPYISLTENGTIVLANNGSGDFAEQYVKVDMANGMEFLQGNLRLSSGSYFGATPDDTSTELYVNGDVKVGTLSHALEGISPVCVTNDGVLTIDGCEASDERLKKDIVPIVGALDIVSQLRGVRYQWQDTERFGTQTEIGLIAQEVEPVLPEVVRDNGFSLTVRIQNIVAVLVEAVKELRVQVMEYFSRTEQLEREVAELQARLAALEGQTVVANPEVGVVNEVLETSKESSVHETMDTNDVPTGENTEAAPVVGEEAEIIVDAGDSNLAVVASLPEEVLVSEEVITSAESTNE